MKKALMGCLLIAVYAFPALASAETYVVGIEPAYPPWASVDSGEFVGIAPDALRAMAKQQGFDITFKSLPFSSLIPALTVGKIDIIATALTVSAKRDKQIDFTVPWWQVNLVTLVRQDSKLNAVTALCCGADVGTQTGTTVYAWLQNELKQNGVDINIHTYESGPTGIRDLEIGRIDSYFTDATAGRQFATANPESIRIAGKIMTYPPSVYALGVQEGNEELLALLNEAVVELYESGKWAEIVHKYLPNQTVAKVPTAMPSSVYQKPIPGLDSD